MLRAHIRAGAVAKAAEAATLIATGDSCSCCAIRNAIIVANANCIRARSAAVNDCNALFRGCSRNTKNLGDFCYALFVRGGTRTVRRRTGNERTGVAVASRETASATVRARQSRSYKTYARILLNRKILVRNGERKRGNRTHTRNNSYRNQNSSHLFSSLISTC
jgi:hypothetical protein